jgi:hypothetical protein
MCTCKKMPSRMHSARAACTPQVQEMPLTTHSLPPFQHVHAHAYAYAYACACAYVCVYVHENVKLCVYACVKI